MSLSFGATAIMAELRCRRAKHRSFPSSGDILPEGNARHLMRLQRGQNFSRKAPDLLHEHFMRQRTTVEADLDLIGTGGFGGTDNPLGDFFRGAQRHVLRLSFDLPSSCCDNLRAGLPPP
jgi:hypothetical protein